MQFFLVRSLCIWQPNEKSMLASKTKQYMATLSNDHKYWIKCKHTSISTIMCIKSIRSLVLLLSSLLFLFCSFQRLPRRHCRRHLLCAYSVIIYDMNFMVEYDYELCHMVCIVFKCCFFRWLELHQATLWFFGMCMSTSTKNVINLNMKRCFFSVRFGTNACIWYLLWNIPAAANDSTTIRKKGIFHQCNYVHNGCMHTPSKIVM